MFFILSKALDFIINPFYWVIIFLLLGLFGLKKKRGYGRKLIIGSLLMIAFFTNPFIINRVLHAWEIQGYPVSRLNESYEAGILLGGSMGHFDEETERPVFSQSVDRLLQTIALYKSGKINKIILSGGSGYVFKQEYKESDYVFKVLINAGVDRNDILIENQSRNTYENAKFTARLIAEQNIKGDLLVITSAFHMRRTLACFSKTGLSVTGFPVDPKSQITGRTPDRLFMPDPFGFIVWDMLLHEWFGMFAYKISGYI